MLFRSRSADPWCAFQAADWVAAQFKAAVKEYPDAGHSFMNDHRDEKTPWLFAMMGRLTGGVDFVEPAALDARGRIAAFFERHLRDGA